MFYVGNELWMEEGEGKDIPANLTGEVFWPDNGSRISYDKGLCQSFQDPETQEWIPSVIFGIKFWFDKGEMISNPESYFRDRGGIKE